MTKRNFIIASYGRCGGHLLCDALTDHPDLCCVGEAFNKYNPLTKKFLYHPRKNSQYKIVQEIFRENGNGFIAHHNQVRNNKIWEKLMSLNVKVIRLLRNNLLERYVSLQIAESTNIWHSVKTKKTKPGTLHGPYQQEVCITIDPRKAEEDFQFIEETSKNSEGFSDKINISYETLRDDFSGTMSRIFKFLGVRQFPVCPKHYKLEHRPMHQVIENYKEVEKYFRNTKWSRFFSNCETSQLLKRHFPLFV
jgi:hypothetical protein